MTVRTAATKVAIPPTKWPDALPTEHEEKFLSVSCGNRHINWSIHHGPAKQCSPALTWRTNKFTPEDLEVDSAQSLSCTIITELHDYLFGANNEPTKGNAIQASNLRRAPIFTVYVVSTNNTQLEGLKYIFSGVPSRLYMMQANDFFTKAEGRNEEISVDRCAALYAASKTIGYPSLVFDGGAALTYMALDRNRKIMGGGITLGLGAKLQALSACVGASGKVLPQEYIKRMTDAQESLDPFPVFSSNTKEAIMSNVSSEVASNCKGIINHWLKKVGTAVPVTASKEGQVETMKNGKLKMTIGRDVEDYISNKDRTILITGGESSLLEKLLEPNHSGVFEMDQGSYPESTPPYHLVVIKALLHLGIAAVLQKQLDLQEKNITWESSIIGQRIAKKFSGADSDGDYLYRGTVALVSEREKRKRRPSHFMIRYDDSESSYYYTEDYNLEELHEALVLFSKVGETTRKKESSNFDLKDMVKKQGSSKTAAEAVEKVAKQISEENEKDALEAIALEVMGRKEAGAVDKVAKQISEENEKDALKAMRRKKATAAQRKKKKTVTKAKTNVFKRVAEPEHAPPPNPKRAKGAANTGKRVAKFFDKEIYFGSVVAYTKNDPDDSGSDNESWYDIDYDDGDAEGVDREELEAGLKLYKTYKKDDSIAHE